MASRSDENRHLSSQAASRLRAIEEFREMGAGFEIAMRDLELRGAGNILGPQQSGHITNVGYELYCTLLEQAVRRLQRLPPKETVDVHIGLPSEAYFPDDYISDMRLKIDCYRRLARFSELAQLAEFTAELRDRFGPIPEPSLRLLDLAEVRIMAHRLRIRGIHLEDRYVVLTYTERSQLSQIAKRATAGLRVADEQTAYLPMGKELRESDEILPWLKSLLQPI